MILIASAPMTETLTTPVEDWSDLARFLLTDLDAPLGRLFWGRAA